MPGTDFRLSGLVAPSWLEEGIERKEGQERVIEGGEKSIWYVLSLKQNPGLNMHTARERKGERTTWGKDMGQQEGAGEEVST